MEYLPIHKMIWRKMRAGVLSANKNTVNDQKIIELNKGVWAFPPRSGGRVLVKTKQPTPHDLPLFLKMRKSLRKKLPADSESWVCQALCGKRWLYKGSTARRVFIFILLKFEYTCSLVKNITFNDRFLNSLEWSAFQRIDAHFNLVFQSYNRHIMGFGHPLGF